MKLREGLATLAALVALAATPSCSDDSTPSNPDARSDTIVGHDGSDAPITYDGPVIYDGPIADVGVDVPVGDIGTDASTGPQWSYVGSGAGSSTMTSVWAISATDIYAVGTSDIVHYDGSAWTAVANAPSGQFFSVWASGANDIFVGGYPGDKIHHYDGTTWTTQATGLAQSDVIFGIAGSSASDVYAVGSNQVLHYAGSSWAPASGAPAFDAYGLFTLGSGVYACGSQEILRYDGSTWTVDTVTGFNDHSGSNLNILCGVWGSSATDLYAVGTGGGSTSSFPPTVFHYDGSGWTQIPTSSGWGSNTGLKAVVGLGAKDVTAVGYGGKVHHWDGSSWTHSPDLGSDVFAIHLMSATFGVAVDKKGAYSFFK